MHNIVIIGGCGAVGNMFARFLSQPESIATAGRENTAVSGSAKASSHSRKVTVIDRSISVRLPDVHYVQVDTDKQLFSQWRESLDTADTVIVALPEDAALSLLPILLDILPTAALLIDTLSVKSSVCSLLEKLCEQRVRADNPIECLSINPMFAPSMGFANQTVVVVPVNLQTRARDFLDCVRQWGADVECMDSAEHDKAAATMQVATHAAILAFGLTLARAGYDADKNIKFSPPPHRALLSMLARICSAEPEVYRDIQASNELASEYRHQLIQSMQLFNESVESNSAEVFASMIADISQIFGAQKNSLAEDCQSMFDSLSKAAPQVD